MMFNLHIQTTHQPGNTLASTNVARREYLVSREVQLVVCPNERHPLVVRREDHARIDSEDG
jgi:hypothetical protein